ncbi:hypothetical protein NDU88_005341 [Pleurodeles waltl]|uniref:Uncharacterized protein n=1 Tax=Pleurodeles waltl TaxID=8319 RepID=A0AAV7WY00_PLEWA|nr:hypothetical protein NDU88_005341 [Pleurodeles waltl]
MHVIAGMTGLNLPFSLVVALLGLLGGVPSEWRRLWVCCFCWRREEWRSGGGGAGLRRGLIGCVMPHSVRSSCQSFGRWARRALALETFGHLSAPFGNQVVKLRESLRRVRGHAYDYLDWVLLPHMWGMLFGGRSCCVSLLGCLYPSAVVVVVSLYPKNFCIQIPPGGALHVVTIGMYMEWYMNLGLRPRWDPCFL